MAVFFTSDTHFGHDGIIRLCKRPFESTGKMDDLLISRWNATVAPGDTVYHLGDFAHRNATAAADYLRALNGTIHLIRGNHDETLTADALSLFASVSPMLSLDINGQDIELCHYPMREWRLAFQGSWHLFGHVHGRFEGDPLGWSLDVGVDAHDFRPLGLPQIEAIFATRRNPFNDRAFVPASTRWTPR